MKTYIINLEKSKDRREHMENLLEGYSFLDYEFVKGFDGKLLDDDFIERNFNKEKFRNYYGKYPTRGEIGCVLSHRLGYEKFLASNHGSCLMLEDDLAFYPTFSTVINQLVSLVDDSLDPLVLLLTGNIWFTSKYGKYSHLGVVRIKHAYATCGYIINRKAANIILKNKPCFVADDWYQYSKSGIKVLGLTNPIVTEHELLSLGSTVGHQLKNPTFFSITNIYRILRESFSKKILKYSGHFVPFR